MKAKAKAKAKAKRARSFYEPADMAAFIRRIARAMVRRAIESGDLEVLVALRQMRADLDAAELEAGHVIYAGGWGYSWTDVAHEVGMTRQAARDRYGDRPEVSQFLGSAPTSVTMARGA